MKPTIEIKEVPVFTCKECDNDISVVMYTRTPYVGVLLECDVLVSSPTFGLIV